MSGRVRVLACVLAAVVSTAAEAAGAAGWDLQAAAEGRPLTLTYGAGQPLSYRFECAPDAVIVTETGVTKLLDLKTNKPVDDAQATIPEGAALMALFGGKGDPQFLPAQAVKNPAGGWDLTIRLAKGDKQLKAVGKSDMVSLFTTGETAAVPMDPAARAAWNDFLARCAAAR
ncbi:MAG: hypothetical protein QOJ94_1455 [Sphingomonadales bacterium]|jgi:hypothetical protein|nr:hypothetical protein [Sphingomonadales bacterium]